MGRVLNEYLRVAHHDDGSHKTAVPALTLAELFGAASASLSEAVVLSHPFKQGLFFKDVGDTVSPDTERLCSWRRTAGASGGAPVM